MPKWFIDGGICMWPLLICSITALAIFLEKMVSLRRPKIIPPDLLNTVMNLITQRKISEAEAVLKQNNSVMANILHGGVSHHGKKRERVIESIEDAGKKEVLQMQRFTGALATIAHISPLLGLLGTVLGMTKVFGVITTQGIGNAQSLAGGIAEALITTIAGLVIAIPTVVAHRYVMSRIKDYVTEVEGNALKVTDLISQE